jgi:hypothetical protein
MVYASRTVYCGAFKSGLRSGYGQIVTAPPLCSEYTGEWQNDQRHGEGNAVFANGVTYQGQWEHDLQHGEGITRWEAGARVGSNNYCIISDGQFSVSGYNGMEEIADIGDGFGTQDFLCFRGTFVKVSVFLFCWHSHYFVNMCSLLCCLLSFFAALTNFV